MIGIWPKSTSNLGYIWYIFYYIISQLCFQDRRMFYRCQFSYSHVNLDINDYHGFLGCICKRKSIWVNFKCLSDNLFSDGPNGYVFSSASILWPMLSNMCLGNSGWNSCKYSNCRPYNIILQTGEFIRNLVWSFFDDKWNSRMMKLNQPYLIWIGMQCQFRSLENII